MMKKKENAIRNTAENKSNIPEYTMTCKRQILKNQMCKFFTGHVFSNIAEIIESVLFERKIVFEKKQTVFEANKIYVSYYSLDKLLFNMVLLKYEDPPNKVYGLMLQIYKNKDVFPILQITFSPSDFKGDKHFYKIQNDIHIKNKFRILLEKENKVFMEDEYEKKGDYVRICCFSHNEGENNRIFKDKEKIPTYFITDYPRQMKQNKVELSNNSPEPSK
jgi:hypothetical protein